jgi:hypothetical protein
MADLHPDPVPQHVRPAESVTFRGYLGEGEEGSYYLWARPSLLERLEFMAADILYRVDGSQSSDGTSTIWVRREARVVRSRFASTEVESSESSAEDLAEEFADIELELGGGSVPAEEGKIRRPPY